VDDDDEIALVAARLRASAEDVDSLVEVVASTLPEFLGAGLVRVRRRRLPPRRIERLSITLGAHTLELEVGPPPRATRIVHSGGVAIAHEPLGLDEWLRELAEGLVRSAAASEDASSALRRFLGLSS